MKYETWLTDLRELVTARLEHYLQKRKSGPKVKSFSLVGKEDTPLAQLSKKHSLTPEEQLLLALTFVPHLDPDFYASVIRKVLPSGGDLPIFGAVKGKNHRGFLPTGETAMFIIAGTDLEKRLKVATLFKSSRLIKNGIMSVGRVEDGEPEMSGRLILGKEYLDLFITGELTTPSFGPDFPAQKIETGRDWSDLILPDHLQVQIEELKVWMLHNDKLMNEWDMKDKIKPGYRALFHGPSGTGKTLTATLLGKYTGREVFRVDLSTIVSKYIGETEKNLEKLFSKAENKDWILFFDEADSLFGKRTDVSDSHDRYANQEVSYLLQRVENFDGLVILSSNYKSNIDDAFLRRFNAILKFTLPDAKERLRIWEKSMPEKMKVEKPLNLEEVAKRYKLTGGSIINVVHRAALDALNHDTDTITLKSVLYGIKRELEKEGKIFDNLFKEEINLNGKM